MDPNGGGDVRCVERLQEGQGFEEIGDERMSTGGNLDVFKSL